MPSTRDLEYSVVLPHYQGYKIPFQLAVEDSGINAKVYLNLQDREGIFPIGIIARMSFGDKTDVSTRELFYLHSEVAVVLNPTLHPRIKALFKPLNQPKLNDYEDKNLIQLRIITEAVRNKAELVCIVSQEVIKVLRWEREDMWEDAIFMRGKKGVVNE